MTDPRRGQPKQRVDFFTHIQFGQRPVDDFQLFHCNRINFGIRDVSLNSLAVVSRGCSSTARRISPRCSPQVYVANTTLRLPACVVLIAPLGTSHASGMLPGRI